MKLATTMKYYKGIAGFLAAIVGALAMIVMTLLVVTVAVSVSFLLVALLHAVFGG